MDNTTSNFNTSWYYTYPSTQPGVCPSCGRCMDCGQTSPVVSPLMWPPNYSPYIWYTSGNDTTSTAGDMELWERASDEDLSKFDKGVGASEQDE